MTSTLKIDQLIEGYFSRILFKCDKYTELRRALTHYDFQDTDGDNQTECYFYFPNDISVKYIDKFSHQIEEILGIPTGAGWEIEDQTKDGNSEIRLSIICHIDI